MVQIIIADDHPVLREGMRSILSQAPDLEVVAARHLIFPDEDPFWDEHVEIFSAETAEYRAS